MQSKTVTYAFVLVAGLTHSGSSYAEEINKAPPPTFVYSGECVAETEFSLNLAKSIPAKQIAITSCATGYDYVHGCASIDWHKNSAPPLYMIGSKRGKRAADLLFKEYPSI